MPNVRERLRNYGRAVCRKPGRQVVANIAQGSDKLDSWWPTSEAQAGWTEWGKSDSRPSMDFDVCKSTANDVRARSEWLLRESTCCGASKGSDKTGKFCTQCCGQQQGDFEDSGRATGESTCGSAGCCQGGSRETSVDFVGTQLWLWYRMEVSSEWQSTDVKMWSAGLVEGTASSSQSREHGSLSGSRLGD